MPDFIMMPIPEKENELDELFALTFQCHDRSGKWHIGVCPVWAENPGKALDSADAAIGDAMEFNSWDDYWIIGTNIVPELY